MGAKRPRVYASIYPESRMGLRVPYGTRGIRNIIYTYTDTKTIRYLLDSCRTSSKNPCFHHQVWYYSIRLLACDRVICGLHCHESGAMQKALTKVYLVMSNRTIQSPYEGNCFSTCGTNTPKLRVWGQGGQVSSTQIDWKSVLCRYSGEKPRLQYSLAMSN
jgi:hypothetical protein